jgi:hypothetical protein
MDFNENIRLYLVNTEWGYCRVEAIHPRKLGGLFLKLTDLNGFCDYLQNPF